MAVASQFRPKGLRAIAGGAPGGAALEMLGGGDPLNAAGGIAAPGEPNGRGGVTRIFGEVRPPSDGEAEASGGGRGMTRS